MRLETEAFQNAYAALGPAKVSMPMPLPDDLGAVPLPAGAEHGSGGLIPASRPYAVPPGVSVPTSAIVLCVSVTDSHDGICCPSCVPCFTCNVGGTIPSWTANATIAVMVVLSLSCCDTATWQAVSCITVNTSHTRHDSSQNSPPSILLLPA
jgi:hypothetical protein